MAAILKSSRTAEGHSTVRGGLKEPMPKMKYRNRFKIVANFLELAREGNSTKTRLTYGSFLSFAQINNHLRFLLSNALTMKSDDTHIYVLTEKGVPFPHVYDEIGELIPLNEPTPAVSELT